MAARWATSSRSVLNADDDLSHEDPANTSKGFIRKKYDCDLTYMTAFGVSCTNDSYTTQPVLGYVGARLCFHTLYMHRS